jgi:hypothetical protein
MYLFLFQAPKHGNVYTYYRYKKSNTRGEFDLRSLRKATKGAVKIWGHGTHPAHLILQDHGLSRALNGHLLEVEDPKTAVWIKLNYDLLGKSGVKYVGGFKDLDVEVMREMSKTITALDAKKREVAQHQWTVNNATVALDRLISNFGNDNTHAYLSKDTAESARQFYGLLRADTDVRRLEDLDLTNNLHNAKVALEDYVKSCGMDPGAR